MNEKINTQIVLLQEELSRLKKVTDYIDNAKINADVVIKELAHIQQNYAHYTKELYGLYKQSIDDLKGMVESKIEDNVQRFENVGDRIINVNQALAMETKNLIEQYEDVVEASDSIIEAIQAIDFHTKLNEISNNTGQLIDINEYNRKITEKNIEETKQLIIEKNLNIKHDIEQLLINEFKDSNISIKEYFKQNTEWQKKQEKESRMIKIFTLIICALIILNMIIAIIK